MEEPGRLIGVRSVLAAVATLLVFSTSTACSDDDTLSVSGGTPAPTTTTIDHRCPDGHRYGVHKQLMPDGEGAESAELALLAEAERGVDISRAYAGALRSALASGAEDIDDGLAVTMTGRQSGESPSVTFTVASEGAYVGSFHVAQFPSGGWAVSAFEFCSSVYPPDPPPPGSL